VHAIPVELQHDMRPTCERVALAHHADYVAHVATTPPLLIITACDPGVDPDPAEILEVIPLYLLPALPNHRPADTVPPPVALLSAKDCHEPSSYVDALSSPHATEWLPQCNKRLTPCLIMAP
jgi:hypothetical protein